MNATGRDPKPPHWLERYHLVFRSENQTTLVWLWLLCLIGMLIFLWMRYGHQGELVDIDDAPARKAIYQVDINTAGWPEFDNLPGIGPTLAQSIVERRGQLGGFRSIEDLRDVPRIGEVKYELIRPFLVLKSEPTFSADE